MKYFVISIDDGTIYDKKVIDILNKHHLRGTFNLNSGLQDFVWYLNGRPIERLDLTQNWRIYDGHEIASHSLTHPHLTDLSGEGIAYEVGKDVENLEAIFHRQVKTFAFPFHDFEERCVDVIRYIKNIEFIRKSEFDDSFRFPDDKYHLKITSLNVYDALEKIQRFIKDEKAELFIFVSHAYDFEVDGTYDKFDELCSIIENEKTIQNVTMCELGNVWNKR